MGNLHDEQYTFLTICRSVLFRVKNISDKSCRENKKRAFCILFLKSFPLGDNVEKYCRPGQATYENIEHAHCMQDT